MRGFLIAVTLLLSAIASAQPNLQHGKITRKDGTTIPVVFHLTVADGTPQSFSYTATAEAARQQALPSDTRLIELENGRVYEAWHIKTFVLMRKDEQRTKADYGDSSRYEEGLRFVERIVNGGLSLYQFVDKYSHAHFFYRQEADTLLTLLQKRTYLDNHMLVSEDLYRNQLSLLAHTFQCEKVQTSLHNLDYRAVALAEWVLKLNNCSNKSASAEKFLKNSRIHFGFGAVGGVVLSRSRDRFYHTSVGPTFGGYIELLPNKNVRNFRLLAELLYHSYRMQSDSGEFNSIWKLEGSSVELNPLINLFLNRKRHLLFLELGGSLQANLRQDRIMEQKLVTNQIYRVVYPKTSRIQVGLIGGVGYSFDRLTILARYKAGLGSQAHIIDHYALIARYSLWKTSGK